MAGGWKTSFKTIPWTKVLSVAPSIADGAKKFWTSVTGKDARTQGKAVRPEEIVYSSDPAIATIEKQVHVLELRTVQLGDEIVLSSEIIDKLAEQQSQLVQAVDILLSRIRALLWVCGVLGLSVAGLIYWLAGR